MPKKILIIGGGAAGFFAAVNHAALFPKNKVTLFEKGNKFLSKVKISGGGRCNVTHACFDPHELVEFYPRGSAELLGPFHHFNCGHTIEWFTDRGVELKAEEDGRMFPVTDSSQTIIDCLVGEAEKNNVELRLGEGVSSISKSGNSNSLSNSNSVSNSNSLSNSNDNSKSESKSNSNYQWEVTTPSGTYTFDKIMIATGSSDLIWNMLKKAGHTIVDPVPSLFTCIIKHPVINGLPGISMPNASVTIKGTSIETQGPLLITHVGLSGPAVLKLSAFGALEFFKTNYKATLVIDFTGNGKEYVLNTIKEMREAWGNRKTKNQPLFDMPQRLWLSVLEYSNVTEKNWADLSKNDMNTLADNLSQLEVNVTGKNTFKEEFVTAGGVHLSEINMKTMESKILPGLFFGGEVLNIDAVTGGFNFQAAWTTGFLAANGMGKVSL